MNINTKIKLVSGNSATLSQNPQDGLCAMEFASWLSNEHHISDFPKCVSKEIAKYCQFFNDMCVSSNQRKDYFLPVMHLLIGTGNAWKSVENRRKNLINKAKLPKDISFQDFHAFIKELRYCCPVLEHLDTKEIITKRKEIKQKLQTIELV